MKRHLSRKQTNASSAHPAQGLSRGDLGAIGVSEAGDELGMRSDVSTFCQARGLYFSFNLPKKTIVVSVSRTIVSGWSGASDFLSPRYIAVLDSDGVSVKLHHQVGRNT